MLQRYEWLDREAYPFESHHLHLDVGKMHYVDEGDGEPIVMVHGNPTWSFLYRHLIKQLAPAYRCVAMDHIGFGLSDKPTDWTYKPAEHAHNLVALVEALDLQDLTLVVQDWGGPIGLSYGINYPENGKRLIILNAWLWPVDRTHRSHLPALSQTAEGTRRAEGMLGAPGPDYWLDGLVEGALGEANTAGAQTSAHCVGDERHCISRKRVKHLV